MIRTIAIATLVAGTLDILSAFVWAGAIVGVLQTVASGPFGGEIGQGPAGAPLGLVVHFAIMAVMATVFVLAAKRIPALTRHWLVAGPARDQTKFRLKSANDLAPALQTGVA